MKKLNTFPYKPTLLFFVFTVSLLTGQLAAQEEGKKIVKLHYVNSKK